MQLQTAVKLRRSDRSVTENKLASGTPSVRHAAMKPAMFSLALKGTAEAWTLTTIPGWMEFAALHKTWPSFNQVHKSPPPLTSPETTTSQEVMSPSRLPVGVIVWPAPSMSFLSAAPMEECDASKSAHLDGLREAPTAIGVRVDTGAGSSTAVVDADDGSDPPAADAAGVAHVIAGADATAVGRKGTVASNGFCASASLAKAIPLCLVGGITAAGVDTGFGGGFASGFGAGAAAAAAVAAGAGAGVGAGAGEGDDATVTAAVLGSGS